MTGQEDPTGSDNGKKIEHTAGKFYLIYASFGLKMFYD